MPEKGIIVVISGPSGCGKNSIIKSAVFKNPSLSYVTSATTREIRAGEKDGVDYHYMSGSEFDRLIETGEILEWDEFCGNRYGTLKGELTSAICSGKNVILDLTISGALAVKSAFPDDAVIIFILPPSMNELENRLRLRLRETDAQIAERVRWAAEKEIPQAGKFDYVIINDILNEASDELLAVIKAEGLKIARNADMADKLLEGFDLKGDTL